MTRRKKNTNLIWCRCRRHSWTRWQLHHAWKEGKSLMCPDPGCLREIRPEMMTSTLMKLGLLESED